MTDELNSVLTELKEIQDLEEENWSKDIIKRTVSSLLAIEKKALYGALRGKQKKIDKVILAELKNYMEQDDADKKN